MTAFDASVLYGAVDKRGPRLARCREALLGSSFPALTTEACIAEAMHLAGSRVGWQAQSDLWLIMRDAQVSVMPCDIEVAEKLMRRYRDVPMDFADATLVALASEESQVRIATFDSDFVAYRRDDGTPVPLVDDRLLGWD